MASAGKRKEFAIKKTRAKQRVAFGYFEMGISAKRIEQMVGSYETLSIAIQRVEKRLALATVDSRSFSQFAAIDQ